ncbi:MAG: nitroreductase family deazaflavin-dependent oxidoreductase [Chloroflexi bacterium]|nr:MAG: nitroreductase family deazaflavin-dependent oxidoreductase [Chloroflexota bacterium]
MKRRLGVLGERFVLNPIWRRAVLSGRAGRTFAILETTGRKTRLPRRVPVGYGLDGDSFWVVAAHGRRAQYVRNVEIDPRVRVNICGTWRTGSAVILDDDDARDRLRLLARAYGIGRRFDAGLLRLLATDLLTIRIDLDRPGGGG